MFTLAISGLCANRNYPISRAKDYVTSMVTSTTFRDGNHHTCTRLYGISCAKLLSDFGGWHILDLYWNLWRSLICSAHNYEQKMVAPHRKIINCGVKAKKRPNTFRMRSLADLYETFLLWTSCIFDARVIFYPYMSLHISHMSLARLYIIFKDNYFK